MMHFSWSKLLLGTLLSLAFLFPWQNAQAERIKDFRIDLVLSENGLLKVTETIRYDFEKARRSAIYRRIPLQYTRHGKATTLTILPLSVKDGDKSAPYTCKLMGGFANLQIGDSKKLLTGQHIFIIKYEANNAVNFLTKVPELFWSCLGSEWSCPIDNVNVVLHAPAKINLSAVKTLSYLGSSGAKGRSQGKVAGNSLQFSASHINSGQDFSCVATFPMASIGPPSTIDSLIVALMYWKSSLAIPAITLVLLALLWFICGRDPLSFQAASAWMPPTDLTPAELGTLIDEHCDKHDITATLLDLACRGYLIITEVPYGGLMGLDNKDYQFKKASSPDPERLKPHEVLLLSSMFVANDKTHLSILRGQYREYLSDMRRLIYQTLVKDQYFARLPQNDRDAFVVVGSLVLGVGVMLLTKAVLAGDLYKHYGMGFALSGLMIIFASAIMPKRTLKGVVALRQAEAFRSFVRSADHAQFERIAREDPGAFGRFLPYACVLGVAEKWAYNFRDLLEAGPDFFRVYCGDIGPEEKVGAKFDSLGYTYGLSRAMATINSTIDSRGAANDGASGVSSTSRYR